MLFVVTYLPYRLYFPKLVEIGGERDGGNRKRERKNGFISRSKDAQGSKRKYELWGWGNFSGLCILLIRNKILG